MSLRRDRELIRQRLEAAGRELDQILSAARDPKSAARAELSVRAGWRLVDKIARSADELATIRPGERPAPSQLMRQADEEPSQSVSLAPALGHKFEWPIRSLHAKHLCKPDEFMAAAHFRNAYYTMTARPATNRYADERVTFTQRKPDQVNADQLRAQAEFSFIWRRLEDELKTLAWVLILQQPLPNDDEPLSPTELGKRMGKLSGDREARWYAFGMMRITLVRVASVYRILDAHKREQRKLI